MTCYSVVRDGHSAFVDLDGSPFDDAYDVLRRALSRSELFNRGRVHAQDVSMLPEYATYELPNISVTYPVPEWMGPLQIDVQPNLPWAEDHFQERVGGEPLNPAPSEAWWPFKVNGNAAHKRGEVFSHTYPERIWPKEAGVKPGDVGGIYTLGGFYSDTGRRIPAYGIRYDYGDLEDVVSLLLKDPYTRQAYLPIWFPEDTGAVDGQRVPCSLGYHFIRRGDFLDCVYTMRSCDFFRHFRDDIYMASRLLQWVCGRLSPTVSIRSGGYRLPRVGSLTTHITNLHAFAGDSERLGVE